MKIVNKILTCIALIFSLLFVGLGYASISDDFQINGIVTVETPKKLFISSVIDSNHNNAVVNSKVYTGTVLNTSTIFNSSSGSSGITYEITFYNGSNLIYEYDQEVIQTHSNNNVSYNVTNLLSGTRIEPKTFITAYLFLSSSVTTTLSSIIDFHFHVANLEDNIGLENHEALIDAMINDTVNGLNNPDSYLSEQILVRYADSNGKPSRDSLGSMAAKQGNELEIMFGDAYSTTEEIAYMFHFIDPNKDGVIDSYYLYTTSIYLGDKKTTSVPLGESIYCIYRTEIIFDEEEGKWKPLKIEVGHAPSAYYEEDQPNMNSSRLPAFDHRNWSNSKIGTSFDDAMWTNVNQEKLTCCHADTTTEKRYYKVEIPRGTYEFVIDSDAQTNAEDVKIEVYDTNKNLISSSTGSATINNNGSTRMYYIVINGALTMDYKFIEA